MAKKKTATRTGAKAKGKKAPKKPASKPSAKKTKALLKPKAPKKKKRPLTLREKELQEIKRKLFLQKEALLTEAEATMNSLPEQTIFPDLGDQASVETDMNFLLRLKGREQRLLKKIDLAIEKIESGTFGICEVCGEEIDIKRLEARPVTTMCISCKTEQEEEERLAGA